MVHWELLITALNKQTFKNWAPAPSRLIGKDSTLMTQRQTTPKQS